MVYKVVMVYGTDGHKVEREIINVAKVKVADGFVTFFNDEKNVIASMSKDGILYYELISLG